MNGFIDTVQKWVAPRRYAERIIHARLDAERGEGEVSAGDEAWLERRLASDRELRIYAEEQTALQATLRRSSTRAPTGFAERVRLAAQSRPKDSLPDLEPSRAGNRLDASQGDRAASVRPWAVAAATAAAAAVIVTVVVRPPEPAATGVLPAAKLEISGPASQAPDAPDFLIRSPGVGAARAQAQIVQILKRHGGDPTHKQDALLVRLPRAELVPALQELGRTGTFKVTPLRQAPLPPSVQTVTLRFDLD